MDSIFIRLVKLFWLFISVFLISLSAEAANDGIELLESCKVAVMIVDNPDQVQPDSAPKGGYCLGFIEGILKTESFYQQSSMLNNYNGIKKADFFCMPSNATIYQSIKVVIKYLDNHPEQLNLSSIVLVFAALKTYFPCQK